MLNKRFTARLWRQRYLLLMSFPFVIWVLAFAYLPLFGWAMAFHDFRLGREPILQTFLNAPSVGLKHFETIWRELTQGGRLYSAFKNTLAMGFLTATIGFAVPVIFAVLLNELRSKRLGRITQTVAYLPHFTSWVAAAGMVYAMLASGGPVNVLLARLGLSDGGTAFMGEANMFRGIFIISDIWKNMGWNSVIFLAAIAGVNPELYDSAAVDGAGRFRRILHITLPCIAPVVIVVFILNAGLILNVGFERQLLLGNSATRSASEVLDTYILRYGIGMQRYSLGAAIGMVRSVAAVILVLAANAFAGKFGKAGIV